MHSAKPVLPLGYKSTSFPVSSHPLSATATSQMGTYYLNKGKRRWESNKPRRHCVFSTCPMHPLICREWFVLSGIASQQQLLIPVGLGRRWQTPNSEICTQGWKVFAFTYQVLGGLEVYRSDSLCWRRDAQDGKTEVQISIHAESLHFNKKEQKYKRESRTHLILCYKG